MNKTLLLYLFLNICVQLLAVLLNKKLVELGYLQRLYPYKYEGLTSLLFFKLFILLVVLAPIFEELAFRLFLVRNSSNIKIGAAVFTSIAAFKTLNYFADLNIFVDYFFQLLLATILYLFLNRTIKDIHVQRLRFIDQNMLLIISSVVFGLFHMGIYHTSEIAGLQVIAVLGYMASGYIFGRFRIKYGIFNSIKLHASVNTLAFIAIVM